MKFLATLLCLIAIGSYQARCMDQSHTLEAPPTIAVVSDSLPVETIHWNLGKAYAVPNIELAPICNDSNDTGEAPTEVKPAWGWLVGLGVFFTVYVANIARYGITDDTLTIITILVGPTIAVALTALKYR